MIRSSCNKEDKVFQWADYKNSEQSNCSNPELNVSLVQRCITNYQQIRNALNVNVKTEHQLLIQSVDLLLIFALVEKWVFL